MSDKNATHPLLAVSVVLYQPDRRLLRKTLETLEHAARAAHLNEVSVTLVDNSPGGTDWLNDRPPVENGTLRLRLLSGHGNIGFARGHNLALQDGTARFNLVLNPDVELDEHALTESLSFMQSHPECGVLTPSAINPDGTVQNLCKRYPSVLVLLLRGFAPRLGARACPRLMARYEFDDAPPGVLWDPPMISGCFLLVRGDVWRELGGFDPRFFLYFEDFDFGLRAARVSRLVRIPTVRITHHGGGAARKGARHVALFLASSFRFFRTHGWRWV